MSDYEGWTDENIVRDVLDLAGYPEGGMADEQKAGHAAFARILQGRDDLKLEVVRLEAVEADHKHLLSEYGFGRDRGDHLVYESEWRAFDAWQREMAAMSERRAEQAAPVEEYHDAGDGRGFVRTTGSAPLADGKVVFGEGSHVVLRPDDHQGGHAS